MPLVKFHDDIANKVFGIIPTDLNKEIDSTISKHGPLHRASCGHSEEEVNRIGEKYKNKYGISSKPLSYFFAKMHVTCDYCPLLLKQENDLSNIPEKDKDVVAILKDRIYELKSELNEKDKTIELLTDRFDSVRLRYMEFMATVTTRLEVENEKSGKRMINEMIDDLRQKGVSEDELPEALKESCKKLLALTQSTSQIFDSDK